ncbi:hypothetical protein TNCV_1446211 [Trichonephila clavipes]|nr:hypothetical protein TNCV_1446211 [Trichonephila clavipes]
MEVGDSFGAGLPAPSENPSHLNFAQNERVFECVCLRMCGPTRGQPIVTLREWVCHGGIEFVIPALDFAQASRVSWKLRS